MVITIFKIGFCLLLQKSNKYVILYKLNILYNSVVK